MEGQGSGVAEAGRLEVFPNPNNGTFTVRTAKAGAYEVSNAVGQVIERFNMGNDNAFTHELSGLSAGVYFVRELNAEGPIQRVLVTE
jgi:hypothetical protein